MSKFLSIGLAGKSSTSQEMSKENVDKLKNLFRNTLGDKTEMNLEEFKTIIRSKNQFFAERAFEIFDEDNSGTVTLDEFLNSVTKFSGQTPDEKLQFLFRVYDLDGNGVIQLPELEHVMKACISENGMRFTDEQIKEISSTFLEDADRERNGSITCGELKAQLQRHDGLLENLSISMDSWLLPIESNKNCEQNLLDKIKYKLTWPYIRNNIQFISFVFVLFAINLALIVTRSYEYRDHNCLTIIARACGQCLNFNCVFILVVMLRGVITFARTHGLAAYLPLDHHIYIHKMTGILIFIYGLLHTVMHLINFRYFVMFDSNVARITGSNFTYAEWIFTMKPGLFGLIPGIANVTGVTLMLVLTIMVVMSQSWIRRGGRFELFYWSHFLYGLFWPLCIVHAPNFWKWFIAPGIIFIIEIIVRLVTVRLGKGKTYIEQGRVLPSRVTHLIVKRPLDWEYSPGDYVFVNIPTIAKNEWHPFTISSAPEQKDRLTMHIRALGGWTKRLHEYFVERQSLPKNNAVDYYNANVIKYEKLNTNKKLGLINPAFDGESNGIKGRNDEVNGTADLYKQYPFDHKNTNINRDVLLQLDKTGDNNFEFEHQEQLDLYLDGPYGTPSSHIFRAEHAVLIATGIGVTPFASILQSIMYRYRQGVVSCPQCQHQWLEKVPESVMNLRKVDFIWVNRDQYSFEWFVELLSQLEYEQAQFGDVMERFLDMHMYITSALEKTDMKAIGLQLALDLMREKNDRDLITGLKTRTNAGRPNWNKIFQKIRDEKKGKVTVFFCGNQILARTLRQKCAEFRFNYRKEVF